MLHPDAVKEFFRQPRTSLAWVKLLSEQTLDDELKAIGFRPAERSKPLRKHQKACILLCLAYPQLALYLEMGLGKTRIMLEVMHHLFSKTKANPTILILVPSESAVYNWEDQIKKWKMTLPYDVIGNSSSDQKWLTFAELDFGFLVLTYPGIASLLSKKTVNKKGKIKLALNQKAVDRFAANITAVVYDESTKLGNMGSLTFRICRAISKKAKYRYALAGRPFGRDPTMLWSQMYLVDRGETLGDTLGLFRAAFFTGKPGYFGGWDYTFRKDMEADLARILQHRSITYAESECQSLPAVTRIIEKVRLPEDARAYYEKAAKAIRLAKGDSVQINNLFLRLRQVSSGFLGWKGEDGEKAEMVFPTNPKLDRLLELIDEMPPDRKFTIFYEFNVSGALIEAALKKAKIKVGRLWSGTKDSRAMLRAFDDDPKMRGLIVNHKLGAMSLNLQVSNYCFFYESPLSVIDRDQAEHRNFRQGQTRAGFLVDVIAKGTVDQRILDFYAEGGDILKAILRNPGLL